MTVINGIGEYDEPVLQCLPSPTEVISLPLDGSTA
jgi:hypothetical protein